ncbi:glycosyltransferase 87 family protein [Gordonia sp. NPDC003429]
MPHAPMPREGVMATVIGWRAVAAVGVLAVAVIVWQIYAIPIGNPFYGLFHNANDLYVYRAGGRTVLDGRLLYEHPVLADLDFTYPPFSALVFTPIAAVSAVAAKVTWWAAIYAALVLTVLLGMRSLGYRIDRRLALFALAAAICTTALEPVRTTIWLGQINVFLMFLVLADLVFLDLPSPNSKLRGIGVGLAAGLKLTPGFFLVYLLVLRRWRAAATAALAFAATVALGLLVIPRDARDYWMIYVTGSSRVGRVDSPANQSVNGFISQMLAYFDIRRFAHPGPGGPVFEAPTWLWVPVALVAAALGLWAAVVAHRRGRELLAVSIVGMTGATVSPFSWGHHWVWVVPLLVVAFDFAYRGAVRGRRYWWRWLAPSTIVALCFTYWWNWWDSGPHYAADHAIALGLFMMPRWPHPGVLDRIAVIVYAGCYPLILLLTIVTTLLADRRERRSAAPRHRTDDPYPEVTVRDGADPTDAVTTDAGTADDRSQNGATGDRLQQGSGVEQATSVHHPA